MKKGLIPKRLRGRKPADERAASMTETISGGRFEWVNMQNPDRADVERLAEGRGFNALNVEDCMTKFELPKLDSYDDHFFVILHFPPLAQKAGMSKNSQLAVFMGRDFLATIHHGDLAPLVELADVCRTGSDPQRRDRLMGGSPGQLLHEIIDVLVDDLLHTSRKIIANLDEMEELVFDEVKPVARSIALQRREINRLRRIAVPLNRFVREIAANVKKLAGGVDELGLYYDDVTDHIDKVIETLEESRETLEIYKDTDFVLSSERTNKVLGMLTIIFTLAIPATVIGTFYGMNIDLPMVGSGLGPHTMFVILVAASAAPAAVMFAYFKRIGWISSLN